MIDPAADLLPEGLEDRLPQSMTAAARVERTVLAVLDSHGYDRVRPPLIEFMQSMARRMDGVKTRKLFRFVDPKSLVYIDGTELDFTKEGINEGFKFNNPNVSDECGCGESFTV